MTIEAAIINLQGKLLSLSGMKAAPSVPPEGTGAFPFAISFENTGSLASHSATFADELVTIISEIHVPRGNLITAIPQAMAFRDPFLKLLIIDPSLGGTISTLKDVRWRFGVLKYNDVETLGYRFEIEVKCAISV